MNVNGALKANSKETEVIEASGSNYIRYSSGLQVCWGESSTPSGHAAPCTFPVPFMSSTSYVVAHSASVADEFSPYQNMTMGTLFQHKGPTGCYIRTVLDNSPSANFIAIGRWK